MKISENITEKIPESDYPSWFINSVIKQFNDKLSQKSIEEDDYILSPDFFEIKKLVILIDVPYCELNKTPSKHLLSRVFFNTASVLKRMILLFTTLDYK